MATTSITLPAELWRLIVRHLYNDRVADLEADVEGRPSPILSSTSDIYPWKLFKDLWACRLVNWTMCDAASECLFAQVGVEGRLFLQDYRPRAQALPHLLQLSSSPVAKHVKGLSLYISREAAEHGYYVEALERSEAKDEDLDRRCVDSAAQDLVYLRHNALQLLQGFTNLVYLRIDLRFFSKRLGNPKINTKIVPGGFRQASDDWVLATLRALMTLSDQRESPSSKGLRNLELFLDNCKVIAKLMSRLRSTANVPCFSELKGLDLDFTCTKPQRSLRSILKFVKIPHQLEELSIYFRDACPLIYDKAFCERFTSLKSLGLSHGSISIENLTTLLRTTRSTLTSMKMYDMEYLGTPADLETLAQLLGPRLQRMVLTGTCGDQLVARTWSLNDAGSWVMSGF